jgi:DNA mismatch endonuclease (patch repair protein)
VTDKISPELRSLNMRNIRAKGTSPEVAVRRLVHAMGFRFRLHVAGLPGKPDLVFPGIGKIIDVRGCFWHQHKGCIDSHVPKSHVEYWRPKLARNKQRDKKTLKSLRAMGWSVLTLWECEIRNETKLRKRLLEFLSQ